MDQAAFTHIPPQHGLAQRPTPAPYQQPHAGPSQYQLLDRASRPAHSVEHGPAPAASGSAASLAPGTRPARSRRQRPCDSCRTAKRRCFKDDHRPCVACQAGGTACTFLEPPHKRSRLATAGADGAGSASEGGAGEKGRKTSANGAGKSRKRPAPEDAVGEDEDDEDEEEDDGHRSAGSAGPGPRTQRMALEQVLNADLNADLNAGGSSQSRRASVGPLQSQTGLPAEDVANDPRVMVRPLSIPAEFRHLLTSVCGCPDADVPRCVLRAGSTCTDSQPSSRWRTRLRSVRAQHVPPGGLAPAGPVCEAPCLLHSRFLRSRADSRLLLRPPAPGRRIGSLASGPRPLSLGRIRAPLFGCLSRRRSVA